MTTAKLKLPRHTVDSYARLFLLSRCFVAADFEIEGDSTAKDFFKSLVGVFVLGKSLHHLDSFKTNRFFQEALGLSHVPSSESVAKWLSSSHCELLSRSVIDVTARLLVRLDQIAPGLQQSMEAELEISSHELRPRLAAGIYLGPDPVENDLALYVRQFAVLSAYLISKLTLSGEIKPNQRSVFNEAAKASLDANGYIILQNVLTEHEADEIREILIRIAAWESEKGTGYFYGTGKISQRVYNLLNKHQVFQQLIQMPLILEIMDHLFKRDTLHDKYGLSSFHANLITGGGSAQIIHCDVAAPEPLPPWIMRANINFMLEDYTERNGATEVLPRSHLFLTKPRIEDHSLKGLVKMVAPKGSLAVWHGHLWHKSGENQTEETRVALLGCFAASHLKELCMEEDYLQSIDPSVVSGFSMQLQKLLGVGHGLKKGAMQSPPDFKSGAGSKK